MQEQSLAEGNDVEARREKENDTAKPSDAVVSFREGLKGSINISEISPFDAKKIWNA